MTADLPHDSEPTSETRHMRKVRSFVRREGRMTKRQENAIATLWSRFGLNHGDGLIDPQQVFGRCAPLVVEIGFGMGKSLVEMARSYPEKDYIGIEVHRAGVGSCLADAEEAGLTNLRLYEHDAVEILRDCLAPASINELLLFFPDPWHKKRHNKRRLIQAPLIEKLVKKLKPGGYLHAATDWEDYAIQILEVFNGNAELQNTAEAYAPRPAYRPLTKFEARGIRLGHGVWDIVFTRK